MRPVSGFERPAIQWLFVSIGVLLAALVAAEAIAIRRSRARIEESRVAEMNARLDRQQIEIELARERAARETLSIEAARLRRQGTAPEGLMAPTLTLSPLTRRDAKPPAPSVEQPEREQVIELRLLLPRGSTPQSGPYTIAVRRWTSGEILWARGGLSVAPAAQPPAVTALVTGDLLAGGSYEVLLTAAGAAGQPPREVAAYEVSVSPKSR